MEINNNLYNRIVTSAALLLKKQSDKNINVITAIDCLIAIVENENLNEVSDIYIYEEGFAESEVKLKNEILHAITTIIGFEYKDENFQYLENIILFGEEIKAAIALDYLLKLGRFHEIFKDRVFCFVEENLKTFSKKQLSTTAWYLINLYPEDERVYNLVRAIEDKAGVKIYNNTKKPVIENKEEITVSDDSANVTEKAQDFEINTKPVDEPESETKPWWKIW